MSLSKAAVVLLASSSLAFELIDDSRWNVLNDSIIDQINNNPNSTWKAGRNDRFEGLTIAQAREMMGARSDRLEFLPSISHANAKAPPSEYDPRVSRKECTGPVLDQAFCGSCWAFGATEAMSDRLCMSKGEGATYLALAPLDMVACNSGFFSGENGCQGGQLGGAWTYGKSTGLVDEECYPYLKSEGGPVPTCTPDEEPCLPESKFIRTPTCTKKCANGKDWESSKHKLKNVYNIPVSEMLNELATNGPVESAFTVYSDFVHYKSGVYQHQTGSALGGHAIKVIGYGTEDGTDYWLVQNSWTTTWGDGGYFKIARGKDECGIEDQFVAGTF